MYKSRTNLSLLEDEEIYSEKELTRKKRTSSYWSQIEDEKIEAERAWNHANLCPKHHLVLTTTGECPLGCGYKKEKNKR